MEEPLGGLFQLGQACSAGNESQQRTEENKDKHWRRLAARQAATGLGTKNDIIYRILISVALARHNALIGKAAVWWSMIKSHKSVVAGWQWAGGFKCSIMQDKVQLFMATCERQSWQECHKTMRGVKGCVVWLKGFPEISNENPNKDAGLFDLIVSVGRV